jgi:Zn-finger protein
MPSSNKNMNTKPPCNCGSNTAEWHDTENGSRTWMCARCWDITKSVIWIQAAANAIKTNQLTTAKQYLWHAHQKLADALEKPTATSDVAAVSNGES